MKSTNWDATERDAWIAELKALVDAPTALTTAAGSGRRLAPPLYGRWYAGRDVLGTDPASRRAWPWVDELNADPRLRVAAALGVAVVQSRQDQLIAGAWAAGRGDPRAQRPSLVKARPHASFARRVHERHLASPDPQVALQLTAPVHGRIIRDATTLTLPSYFAEAGGPGTAIRPGILAAQWRRIARRTGPVARRQGALTDAPTASTLLERLMTGELEIAPPAGTPSLLANLSALVIELQGDLSSPPGGGPGFQPESSRPNRSRAGTALQRPRPAARTAAPGAEFRAAVVASWSALTAPDPAAIKLTHVVPRGRERAGSTRARPRVDDHRAL
jgi:hypothetical protein